MRRTTPSPAESCVPSRKTPCWELAARGIRTSVIRLPPIVHGAGESRPDHALRSKETWCLSYCEAIYACVAGFVLKMPLKLSRYCRKTRIHNTLATSAGAMLPGAIVR
jgi:hypothetical protein